MEIVSAITAYHHPRGETDILEVDQALYSPQQEPSLLNPNQMKWNLIIVDNIRHQFNPCLTHSIRFVRVPIKNQASVLNIWHKVN
jgi:hypothetical protein